MLGCAQSTLSNYEIR